MRAKRAGKIWNWTVASKHVIIGSELENFSNWTFASKASGNFWKILRFPPNSSKLRSDYLFSFQKRTNDLFPAFSRSEYLFPKSASPPPPLRIKWSSPYLHLHSHEDLGFKKYNIDPPGMDKLVVKGDVDFCTMVQWIWSRWRYRLDVKGPFLVCKLNPTAQGKVSSHGMTEEVGLLSAP